MDMLISLEYSIYIEHAQSSNQDCVCDILPEKEVLIDARMETNTGNHRIYRGSYG